MVNCRNVRILAQSRAIIRLFTSIAPHKLPTILGTSAMCPLAALIVALLVNTATWNSMTISTGKTRVTEAHSIHITGAKILPLIRAGVP